MTVSSTTVGNVVIGGLAGDAQKPSLKSCSNDGRITVENAASADVGGLFGIARNAVFTANSGDGTIGNNLNVADDALADDYANLNVKAATANVGGLIGWLPAADNTLGVNKSGEVYAIDNDAEYLVSLGDVLVEASSEANVGGFVGRSEGSRIVIPLISGKSTAKAVMTVGNLIDAAGKKMELQVICGDTQLTIPTDAIDTASVMKSFKGQKAADVPFTVTIKTLSKPEREEFARETGYELLGEAVSFYVTAGSGNAVCPVKSFTGWTERVLPVEDGAKITTGVEIINGKAIHKPTNVRTIFSLTDSVYAYIYNDVKFADAKGKWYESAVNEMASRLIVNGRGKGKFEGGGTTTRAEFAAMLVRALGLHEDGDGTVFSDVKAKSWYCGAVGTAYEYGLIKGRGHNRFEPNALITREEAMVVMQRAAKIAGLKAEVGNIDRFADAAKVSRWAVSAAKFNVGAGLIKGSGNKLAPGDFITRGESATLILRFLRQSGLVDVRSGK